MARPDALTGGAYLGGQGGAILYTSPTSLPAATRNFLAPYGYMSLRDSIFGGTASVSSGVATQYTNDLNASHP